jgi:hypothetical protein
MNNANATAHADLTPQRRAIFGPYPCSWGHVSHKHFALRLSRARAFEEKLIQISSKKRGNISENIPGIFVKLRRSQFA